MIRKQFWSDYICPSGRLRVNLYSDINTIVMIEFKGFSYITTHSSSLNIFIYYPAILTAQEAAKQRSFMKFKLYTCIVTVNKH